MIAAFVIDKISLVATTEQITTTALTTPSATSEISFDAGSAGGSAVGVVGSVVGAFGALGAGNSAVCALSSGNSDKFGSTNEILQAEQTAPTTQAVTTNEILFDSATKQGATNTPSAATSEIPKQARVINELTILREQGEQAKSVAKSLESSLAREDSNAGALPSVTIATNEISLDGKIAATALTAVQTAPSATTSEIRQTSVIDSTAQTATTAQTTTTNEISFVDTKLTAGNARAATIATTNEILRS